LTLLRGPLEAAFAVLLTVVFVAFLAVAFFAVAFFASGGRRALDDALTAGDRSV
jgi:hypothetical protein